MSNVTIHAGLVNGDLQSIIAGRSSEVLVDAFAGDYTGSPVSSVTITVLTDSGKQVQIVIPNSSANAWVKIDGEMI